MYVVRRGELGARQPGLWQYGDRGERARTFFFSCPRCSKILRATLGQLARTCEIQRGERVFYSLNCRTDAGNTNHHLWAAFDGLEA